MTSFGVKRLVIINSGGYRFADVALDGPIHLVAPNNRGKSTLVNALQFLYVDDFRKMRFPRSPDETREHYFGRSPSYLLFECRTVAGPQSLLVVGRGRVGGSAFARYVFAGEYRSEDFADAEGRVADFDLLRTRLADRSLAEVKPTELWETLCNPSKRGRPEENGHRRPHLGLLPIRGRDDYRSFREAYVRLLSLSDMSASELRQLLIACHAATVGEIKLDVAADYRDEFERAERTEARLAFLDAAGHLIDDGERRRSRAAACLQRIESTAPSALAGLSALLRELREAESAGLKAEAALDARQVALTEARDDVAQRQGSTKTNLEHIRHELAELDLLHAKWSSCSADMVQAMRDNADATRDKIATHRERLRQAGSLNLAAMRRSVQSLQQEADGQARSIDNWEKQLSGWLAERGMPPERIVAAFRVLNPALLRLIIGEDLQVLDASALLSRLEILTERIEADTYEDESVRACLASVRAPDPNDLKDPAAARESLRLVQSRLREELDRLAVAEDTDRARATLETLEQEHARLAAELREHEGYLTKWRARPDREQELATLEDGLRALAEVAAKWKDEERSIAADRRRFAEDARARRDQTERLTAAGRNFESACHAAQVLPAASEPAPAMGQDDLPARVDACISALDQLTALAGELESERRSVKAVQQRISQSAREHAQPQYFIGDDETDWAELIDARKSTPELHQANQQSWDALFTTIRARLDALMRGCRAIGNATTRVNAAMKRHRVSNLREVQLEVLRQHEACDLLESLTSPDGLFADREALEAARDRLRRWIKEGRIIRLEDLFIVRIRVQGMDGQWSEAKSLDDIGSTGTGMTAKAMIFIQLVRAVVADERYKLHFYLDETGQLDDWNLAATTAMAVERGVVPITAEPRTRVEPLAHPTVTVYSLGQEPNGLFNIDGRRTLKAARRSPEREPVSDVADSA